MLPPPLRFLFLSLVATLLTGCASWQAVNPTALERGPDEGDRVAARLVLLGGGAVVLEEAVVLGDSIVGRVGTAREAFALRDLSYVEVRGTDTGKTAALIGALAAAGVVVLAVAGLVLLLDIALGIVGG